MKSKLTLGAISGFIAGLFGGRQPSPDSLPAQYVPGVKTPRRPRFGRRLKAVRQGPAISRRGLRAAFGFHWRVTKAKYYGNF